MFFDRYKKGLKCVSGLKILLVRPHKIIDFWSILDPSWGPLGGLLEAMLRQNGPPKRSQVCFLVFFTLLKFNQILMKFWRVLETAQNRKNAQSAIGVLDFDLPETAKWPPEGPLLILKGPQKEVKILLQLKK